MNKWLTGIVLLVFFNVSNAQFREANVLEGEFGVAVGASHYFGDLNTRSQLNRPKLAVGLLFRKQFGDYVALRVQGSFIQVGYSDIYSDNEAQRIRNLSFNSNIIELGLMGDFNFFRFIPGDRDYRFTPYVSFGLGAFTYDPYAFLNSEKHYLRPLGTEGQGSSLYPEKKPYSSMAVAFPVGFGIKYNLTPKTNVTFEITHRFTSTDYLDDVSGTYAGIDAFLPLPNGDPSPAMLLQDRSYETTSVPIGIAGRQRGISTRKDQFITAMVGITFNLTTYKCPPTY
jgi:hypothetical protein